MKASNSFLPAKQESFGQYLTSTSTQSMIQKALGSPERAANFISTLISIQVASPKLRECDMNSILSAALRGEGMNLSLALGQYNIIPYRSKAVFQISAKGLAQMAIRTGQYLDLNVFDVREGEYVGRDAWTRRPLFKWIEDDEKRDDLPLSGFYAFYKLTNGFFKCIYWTHNKILQHANRYSEAFSLEKYNAILSGKRSGSDGQKINEGSPWYEDPLSEAHQKMCKKTMLIQLLNDGEAPLSTELQKVIVQDQALEQGNFFIPNNEDERIPEDNQRLISEPENIPKDQNVIDGKKTETLSKRPRPKDAKKDDDQNMNFNESFFEVK